MLLTAMSHYSLNSHSSNNLKKRTVSIKLPCRTTLLGVESADGLYEGVLEQGTRSQDFGVLANRDRGAGNGSLSDL